MMEEGMLELCILLYLIGGIAGAVIIDTMGNKKTKRSPEYKTGYKNGFERYDYEEYKRFKKFLGTCKHKCPERNYALGYVWGYADARGEKDIQTEREMCKTERDYIKQCIDEN